MKRHAIGIAASLILILSTGACYAARTLERSKPVSLTGPNYVAPVEGQPVDIAPFGEIRSWEDGRDVGVLWEDARETFKVQVEFASAAGLPDPAGVKVQYWKDEWPQRRIPRDTLPGSGGSGWQRAGDWYSGGWQNADVELAQNGTTWTYTFRPVNQTEFPELKNFDAKYRTALKLRVLFPDKAPAISGFHCFSDSAWQKSICCVEWGRNAARKPEVWDGKAEAFNGYISKVTPLGGAHVKVAEDGSWTSTVKDKNDTDGVILYVWSAKPAVANTFDETIVTVRTKMHSFSFLATKFVMPMVPDPTYKTIYLRDFGVLVKGPRDGSIFPQLEQEFAKSSKSLYDRITTMPEQTLTRTWGDMPKKGRIYMPLSIEGGRQHFRLRPDGNIQLSRGWTRRVGGPDSDKIKWNGEEMYIDFGLPREGAETGASIEDNVLPIATTWYEKDGLRWTEETFATPLRGMLPPGGRVPAFEPDALMMKFTFKNSTASPKELRIPIRVTTNDVEQLTVNSGLISTKTEDAEIGRMFIRGGDLSIDGKEAVCQLSVPANGSADLYATISFENLTEPAGIAQLKALNYDQQHKMIANYWRGRYVKSTQVVTPEPMINNFFAANASHQLINSENDIDSEDRAMAKVGTFYYGVYTNESVMMSSELDRRGYHDIARKIYETWLHYQGTVNLPGDYTEQSGVFYGANRYEAGGYNQHHGWALWGMGEHYWFTHDKAWLQKAAPKIIKACDWIITQRSRTKTDECVGIRAIEYGLLPPGSLEDIGDWRCWLSNNAFSWWGMDSVARALADIGHPEAQRLVKEAAAYKADIRKAFLEAMLRSPVVSLRDGTRIPIIPSEIHRRGRSYGWITETLEGSIHLLRCGVIGPNEPAAAWIMKDFEDNRYISDSYGYQIPPDKDFEEFWFTLGGFSQQPSLLCSPTPYIMTDQPKHYLRSYFNAFAAGYFPERQMLTEHPLPNLGDYRGDHFKSSDEGMNTSWIGWMFVWDEGNDLYLGKVMPRYWLADGKSVSIKKAQTHFGEMSMTMRSMAAKGRIEMTIEPPAKSKPGAIYARFRHPDQKLMKRVTVDGRPWRKFDPKKEWVVLPPLAKKTVVVAYY